MIRRILNDRFYRDSAVVFVASVGASFLNFLLHPVLARLLSVDEYGEIQALLALPGGIAIFLGVFGMAAMNITANADGHDHQDVAERRRLITMLRNAVLMLAAVAAAIVVAMSAWMRDFFQFESVAPIMLTGLGIPLMIPLMFRQAFLRGSKRFVEAGASMVVERTARLACAISLALVGLRASGVILAGIVGALAALVYSYLRTKNEFTFAADVGWSFDEAVRREMRYAGMVLAVSLVNVFLVSADVLFVKHYFDPETAGAYAGISVVAKIVLFATGAAPGVLQTSVRVKAGSRDNQALLGKTLVFVALLGGVALALLLLFPAFIVGVVVGSQYQAAVALLPMLALLMLLTSFATAILGYYLSLRDRFAAWSGMAGVILIVALAMVRHGHPGEIIEAFLVGVGLILVLILARWAVALRALRVASAVVSGR
jgi:O-antigen/teichoic acid export membrane protein